MKKLILCYALLTIMISPMLISGEIVYNRKDTILLPQYLPPEDESPVIYEFGVGLGLTYGLFGGRFTIGNTNFSGDIGFGIIPFSWDASFSLGGSVHFFDRYSAVRPKITAIWSNTCGYNLILGKSSFGTTGDYKVLYKEAFPGFAVYMGLDYRLGKTSNFVIDLNIGAVFPSAGFEKIKKRYNDEKHQLESRGWTFENETASFNSFPKISLGVSYVIGRALDYRY